MDAQIAKTIAKLDLENSNSRLHSRLLDRNYPSAMGERVILSLLINLAIREILHLDIPLVVEDIFRLLDMDYLKSFVTLMRETCSQVILLTYPDRNFEQFGLNSDYYLQLDNETNKSIIISSKDN